MSKKNLIAIAVAAALVAPGAYAAAITEAGVTVNSNQFDDATSSIVIGQKTVGATASDNYLGRTVGYNVRVKISAGKILTPPTIGVAGGAASASLVTGTGTVGSTEFVVRVVPNAAGTQVGEGFTITGLELDNLASLGAGGTVSLSGSVFDPTTGIELANSQFSKVALTAKEGVAVTFTATTDANVIDVGAGSGKKFFTEAGGAVNSGNNTKLFNAGAVSIADATDVLAWLAPTGTADITVSGLDFNAFKASTATGNTAASIYLSDSATCAGSLVAGSMQADNKSVKFTGVNLGSMDPAEAVPGPATAPYTAYVCFDANSVTQIAKQDLSASAVVKPGTGFLNFSSATQALASMNYNGAVERVWHFNPASNAAQESFLRITNTSATSGLVTIDAICDDGSAAPSSAKVNLNGQASIILTSGDVENGNAAKNVTSGTGACVAGGKRRLTITGEFGSMQVQNFLRNSTSAGIINTNVNNEK